MIKVNPSIVVREELEGWGVIFDPDTGDSFGLNAVGVLIWKGLEAGKDKKDILKDIGEQCEGGLPAQAADDFDAFIAQLTEKGYVSAEE